MKVIIFGSNGMLGSYLTTYLKNNFEIIPLTRNDIDLSIASDYQLMEFLNNTVKKGDVIINACGIIKQREYNSMDMIKINSLFPQVLAKFKNLMKCEVIHITTDCVFSGSKGGYIETDVHDCIDDYGKSKSLGENPDLTIIRTSIIGEEKQNKKSLLEWVISNKDKNIDGYENHLWNGVTCLELSKLITDIINTKLYWIGVRHIFSPNTVSKFELVYMINYVYNLDITITKKNTNNNCFRNLSTNKFQLIDKPLFQQIVEQKDFKLC